jgi:hypothetical protein
MMNSILELRIVLFNPPPGIDCGIQEIAFNSLVFGFSITVKDSREAASRPVHLRRRLHLCHHVRGETAVPRARQYSPNADGHALTV